MDGLDWTPNFGAINRTSASLRIGRLISHPDFYHPPYTLPLINAMPTLSTNIIDDDDTSSSTIPKLDSD